jgi:hypothetical protein
MQITLRPARASCSDAAFPAKPPPMTITSDDPDEAGLDTSSVFACACSMRSG